MRPRILCAMSTVNEVWPEHTLSGSPEAIRIVFEQMPSIMQNVVAYAASHADRWISYEEGDSVTGRPRGSFARSFGGYRSKDPSRARPFHLGKDGVGLFYLLVDPEQASGILG